MPTFAAGLGAMLLLTFLAGATLFYSAQPTTNQSRELGTVELSAQ